LHRGAGLFATRLGLHDVWLEHRQERVDVDVADRSEERVDEFPLRGAICVGVAVVLS